MDVVPDSLPRIVAAAESAHKDRNDRTAAATEAWLQKRTIELCGPLVPATPDLFDRHPAEVAVADSRQRLAVLVADPSAPLSRRHEAAAILARAAAQPPVFPRSTLTTLGLLMRVP